MGGNSSRSSSSNGGDVGIIVAVVPVKKLASVVVETGTRLDGWLDGWMDVWMDAWIDGWMDGWIECSDTSATHLTNVHFAI
ncbi:hypothetical protein M0802_005658 [Mischocyttarus mexicanus]|nr:hypothetical protein M0802_005658 [Mischocyttarus mexicanus]